MTNGSADQSGSDYVPRVIDAELDELLPQLPSISIEGAKGVGKTETATRRARTIHRLDDPEERAILEGDLSRLGSGDPPVLIDEWQRVPASWDVVRRAVDDNPGGGPWILTGSAEPTTQPTHSGAGRIVTLRMRPMTLAERGIGVPTVSLAAMMAGQMPAVDGETAVSLEDYAREIVSSGFPGIRRLSGHGLEAQLDSYIDRIVEKDFTALGGREIRNPAGLRRWMAAYAAATATTASYETIRDAATSGQGDKPAKSTTIPYSDVLERLWVVEPVHAWHPTRNHIGRLTSPPKHHLADPGLAAAILGADASALLDARPLGPPVPRDGTLLGHLFESLVTLSVRVFAQRARATVKHLRTRGGEREIDLIVERRDHRVVAIEVKLSQTIEDKHVRHLHWLRDRLGPDLVDAVVVNTGRSAYRRADGIAVVPAALLGP